MLFESTVVPTLLFAASEQVYSTPAVNPVTVSGDPLPLAVRVDWPDAEQVPV